MVESAITMVIVVREAVSTWVEIQPGVYVYFDKNGLAYPPRVLN